jgi:3-oxoacyl-[acyl-carrier protein] reductase/pteridine reductase
MEIRGKTALVTGGAVRVGKSITLALAQAGANVIINYHSSEDAALETAAQAESLGVHALAIRADVAQLPEVERMWAAAAQRFGGVDILVNSASLFRATPFPTNDVNAWHLVTRILIDGSFYCANCAAPYMLQKGEGAIVNIVDLSVYEAWPNFTAHAVGKSALLALTRQLALELGPAVRVNAVAPGPVLPPDGYSPEKIELMAQRTLLNRWGTPEDVAQAVVFLVQADYITAEVIRVDGGEHFAYKKRSVQGE